MKVNIVHRLKWLPNAITFSRAVLSLIAFVVVLHGEWKLGFWILVIALLTDFLDGLAAKKLNAMSNLGGQIDGLADSTIVIFGLLGLSFTGHLSWWITAIVFLAGALIGDRFFTSIAQKKWRKPAAVISLFLAWIGVMWFYAYLAFGWSWWYVPLTIAILAVCGLLKRHRIRAWLHS